MVALKNLLKMQDGNELTNRMIDQNYYNKGTSAFARGQVKNILKGFNLGISVERALKLYRDTPNIKAFRDELAKSTENYLYVQDLKPLYFTLKKMKDHE